MHLILCHTTADFDTLGAAVGLTCLQPGSRIVLTGGAHPTVRDFLALHRDEYALIERKAVNSEQIQSISVVDTQRRDRLGKTAEWLDLPDLEVTVYDHHLEVESDIPAVQKHIAAVGATTTLIVEQLQAKGIQPTAMEATVMALGIHVDTGSLTFDHATPRDARALAWLMEQGASLRAIANYTDPGLSPQLQALLTTALEDLQTEAVQGHSVAWVRLRLDEFVPGLSSLASHLMDVTEIDALLLAAQYRRASDQVNHQKDDTLTVIGRSQIDATDLNELLKPLGGGGHPRAASVNLHNVDPKTTLAQLVDQLKAQIPHPPTARELMSAPVRTIRPETTIDEAQRILLRYGHSGLSVVDADGRLVGMISRRDLDIALHHGFSHAPVKGYMTTNLKTITPETPLPAIESIMVTYDIGRLPVLDDDHLVGIVTRTDVLRQLHRAGGWEGRGKGEMGRWGGGEMGRWGGGAIREKGEMGERGKVGEIGERGAIERTPQTPDPTPHTPHPTPSKLLQALQQCLKPELWQFLEIAAQEAETRGWHLYLVGGAVRDLMLEINGSSRKQQGLMITDVDLVVDGFHRAADAGAGVELARSLQSLYPQARLEVHGKFQTAALLWHHDPVLNSLWVDIATARTEFYPYPAANPEVEASSIRQDLYRRDFTINAMAIRLTPPRGGEILDFFGGLLDLQAKQIRVLHANSFIEDPTRIYRAVRFAVRLGFQLDAQTEGYIRYAIASGVYQQIQTQRDPKSRIFAPALQTRLRAELKYILQSPAWKPALRQLEDLGALQCIHPTLEMTPDLWRQMRLAERWLKWVEKAQMSENTPHPTPHTPPPLSPSPHLPPWLLLLEVLLAQLEPAHRPTVAENLQLPADSIERMRQLEPAQQQITDTLPNCHHPSEAVHLLRQYDITLLLLVAIRTTRLLRHTIWQYLTQWSTVKPYLDGNALKTLGYKQGPQFREILDALAAATLDGIVTNRLEAEAFLQKHFPKG